jgi:hypothetical protein
MSELNASNLRKEQGNEGPDLVGVTELTSPYYMVPPSGNTAERPENPQKGTLRFNTDIGSLEYFKGDTLGWESVERYVPASTAGRAFVIGDVSGEGVTNSIEYVSLVTAGNGVDFGDLTSAIGAAGACADSVRGIRLGGVTSYPATMTNVIDYFSLGAPGNAVDFGDMAVTRRGVMSWGDRTRGGVAGGSNPWTEANKTEIDYITIQSKGNTTELGDLTAASGLNGSSSWGSTTRGLFGCIGSNGPASNVNTVDYVTMQSTGNAIDFGDLTYKPDNNSTSSNSIRGLCMGGNEGGNLNTVCYCTIATTGNFADFGDLVGTVQESAATASPIRSINNRAANIDAMIIMTLGNATDWGDMTRGRDHNSMMSNVHGGL